MWKYGLRVKAKDGPAERSKAHVLLLVPYVKWVSAGDGQEEQDGAAAVAPQEAAPSKPMRAHKVKAMKASGAKKRASSKKVKAAVRAMSKQN